MMRSRRPIPQAGRAFLAVAAHPPMGALAGHAELGGHVSGFTAIDEHSINKQLSTMDGQPGISVGHEDLRV